MVEQGTHNPLVAGSNPAGPIFKLLFERISVKSSTEIDEISLEVKDVWSDDVLNRKKVAEKFTTLLGNINQNFVISINAPYGTGKTFFIERWHDSLPQEDFATLFYNAWKTDFHEHAFVPFLYSVYEQIKEKKLIGETNKLYERLQKTSEKVISTIVGNLLELTMQGLIKKDDLESTIQSAQGFNNKSFFQAYKERQENLEPVVKDEIAAGVEGGYGRALPEFQRNQ